MVPEVVYIKRKCMGKAPYGGIGNGELGSLFISETKDFYELVRHSSDLGTHLNKRLQDPVEQ
jgi:hypothetical protein